MDNTPSFRALLAEGTSREYRVAFATMTTADLPPGEVLIEVDASSLNYKDALAVTGKGRIIRSFPMVCGIDLAGRVLESSVPRFRPGDAVVAVGQGLGETRWGGYTQRARLPATTLVPLPAGLSYQQAMAIGTAGFTAMLSVLALEHEGVRAPQGEVVVTGASGGVGSMAVALLSARGYRVVASTGRAEQADYLRRLGASAIIDRAELAAPSAPLASERWAGAIDTVGGSTLASLIASTKTFGAVAACGLAGSHELHTTVYPFILRNVALLGINSTETPLPLRLRAWSRLASDLPHALLDEIATVEPLSRIHDLSGEILAGRIRGRVVLDVNA